MEEKSAPVQQAIEEMQVAEFEKTDGLDIHLVDDHCVVYDTVADRIHYLNPTAALVPRVLQWEAVSG